MPANNPKTEDTLGPETSALVATGLPVAFGSVAVQAWVDMGAEALRFVWDRLQQDFKTQQAMLTCTSLEEIQQVQTAFFATAQEQYTTEAGKMLDLIGKAASLDLTSSTKARSYDDMPL